MKLLSIACKNSIILITVATSLLCPAIAQATMEWAPVYSTDFSTDPGWMVGGEAGYLYYDSPGGLAYVSPYHNFYAVTPVTLTPNQSFKVECDLNLLRLDWAGNMTFGLYGSTIEAFNQYGPKPYVRINFGRGSNGQSIVLEGYDSSGILRSTYLEPAPWSGDVWYHEELLFDRDTGTLSATVTRKSDNFTLWSASISDVPGFSGLAYLGVSNRGLTDPYYRITSAMIDNVSLSVPVPESSTFIAGALLTFPFLMPLIRKFRKQ